MNPEPAVPHDTRIRDMSSAIMPTLKFTSNNHLNTAFSFIFIIQTFTLLCRNLFAKIRKIATFLFDLYDRMNYENFPECDPRIIVVRPAELNKAG